MKENLNSMIKMAKARNTKVLLIGIRIPPNYGETYTQKFQQVFAELSDENKVALVPMLLKNVEEKSELFQADGIHPTEAAQPILLENVWVELVKLIATKNESRLSP